METTGAVDRNPVRDAGLRRASLRRFAALRQEVVRRYAGEERGVRFYVNLKLRSEPLARFAAEEVEPGARVLDIGCGFGQMALLCLYAGASEAIGFDSDPERIAAGRRAASGLPVRLHSADAVESDFPDADLVMMADMLHYLPANEQNELVRRAARAVRPGGQLWLREMVSGRGWRSRLGISSERALAAVHWHRSVPRDFRSEGDYLNLLVQEGLRGTTVPMWGPYPYANVLIRALRPT